MTDRPPRDPTTEATRPGCRYRSPPSRRMQPAARYVCDSCGEEIEIPIDLTAGSRQSYVEDCPVCCNPNVVHVTIDADGVPTAWAEAEQDRS